MWLSSTPFFTKRLFILCGIIFCALFSRFYLLSQIPTSLAHDEMIYAVNAQSLARSGTDTTGTWNPWSLTPMHPQFAELPTVFMAPFFWLPVEPVISVRLPFVLLSLILPMIIGGIAFEMFRDRKIAVTTGILAIFNPWLWQFGRLAFDPYWSLSFYSLGAYMLLRFRRWAKLWAVVPFFLGFYEYQGHKLGLLPWVGIFAAYLCTKEISVLKKKKWKVKINWKGILPPILVFAFSLVLTLVYIFIQLPRQPSATRLNSLMLPNSPEIIELVNTQRRLSINTPLTALGINKYTVWVEEIVRKYAEAYSVTHLFVHSQFSNFNVWTEGVFYLLDAPLMLFGVVFLWKKRQFSVLACVFAGVVFTVISAIVGHGDAFTFRTSLSIPLLLLITGVGAVYLWKILPAKLFLFATMAYGFSIAYFAFQYFIRYPVYAADGNAFSGKILSEYVSRVDPSRQIIIYTGEPHFTYSAYLFYNNVMKHGDVTKIQKAFRDEEFLIQNVRITGECVPQSAGFDENVTTIVGRDAIPCKQDKVAKPLTNSPTAMVFSLAIAAVKDSGSVYRIAQDTVCKGLEHPDYLYISNIHAFNVKHLSRNEFCQTWLIKN